MEEPEFAITSRTKNSLNAHIQKNKKKNPDYDVFSVSISGRGGVIMGTTTVYIVWKLKGEING
ncbi:hypothetical protein LCGC14_1316060 [marine sediment metagenome]|uniref:Uncharacterized protein n=1 Tax=marine sediment metagenome TaxID=412755 RepID=A0A0F9KLI2_9ZZZZ|nr:hypothetical protein [bacterium]